MAKIKLANPTEIFGGYINYKEKSYKKNHRYMYLACQRGVEVRNK